MINLDTYTGKIKHDACMKQTVESSNTEAIQLDGNNGLARQLGFHSSGFKKVDYLRLKDNEVYLIEMTNLKDDIMECIECDEMLKNSKDVRRYIKEIDKDGLRKVQKKMWLEILEEFKGKWMGSIALYERTLRRNRTFDDPNYRLIVVLRNDTDTRHRDLLQTTLRNKLSGMISKIDVYLTNEI